MRLFESIIAAASNAFDGGSRMLADFGPGSVSFGPSHSGPESFVFGFIVIIGIIVVGGILFNIGKGVTEWADNNQQPVLTVRARMVAKRKEVSVTSSHHHNDHHHHLNDTTSSTTHYATFEFGSGDRKEFEISGSQFGLLAEGDAGELTFQGTRYKGFQRKSFAGDAEAASTTANVGPGDDESARPDSAHSFCPHCGVQVSGAFKFCPHCGKEQPVYTANT